MEPEVTVVIPTFNRRTMVREAIASVLAQENVAFELVVIDDGSTDGTFEDLRALAAEYRDGAGAVRVARTANRGPAAARNLGVAHGRAALVAFLDSDDLWAKDKLRRQLALMRANPSCVLSQTAEFWLRGGKRLNPGRRHRKRAGDIFIDSLRTCLVSPSAAMIRTALFRSLGGFDETMAACEDYDLWLRVLVRSEAGLLSEPLVIRRAGHPGQLSATVPALDRFRVVTLLKLLAEDSLGSVRREAVCAVLSEKCRIYAAGCARRGRCGEAAFIAELAARARSEWRAGATPSVFEMSERMRALLPPAGGASEQSRRASAGQGGSMMAPRAGFEPAT